MAPAAAATAATAAAPRRLHAPASLPPSAAHVATPRHTRTTPFTPAASRKHRCRRVDLEIIRRSGSDHEVWLVERVEPVLARPHFLLATLLLCNSAAMETLPLFLDRLFNPVAAIILSGGWPCGGGVGGWVGGLRWLAVACGGVVSLGEQRQMGMPPTAHSTSP